MGGSWHRAMLAVAVAASALALTLTPVPAPAAHACEETSFYRYCGEHATGLPLRFSVVQTSASPFTAAQMRELAGDAAEPWNRMWPAAAALNGLVWGLGEACVAICIDPTGTSTIRWRQGLAGTCSPNPDALAVTCLTYQGSHRIVRADIILNAQGRRWHLPSPAERVAGEVEAYGSVGTCTDPWWDPGATLTHEFGHALGLEDLPGAWPSNLTHIVQARQTMYWSARPCSTNKRVPREGDLLGLRLVAADSAASG